MEYTQETISEFESILKTAFDYASARVELRNDFTEIKELEILKIYQAELEDKMKMFIQLKNDWKEVGTKRQINK